MATNVTTDDLQKALNSLANSLGLSVKEFVEGGYLDINTYATDKAAIMSRLDSIDKIDSSDNIETIAEKVKALDDMFTKDGNLATDVLNRIAGNASAITDLSNSLDSFKSDVTTAQSAQDSKIDANKSDTTKLAKTVDDNKTVTDTAIGELGDRITANEGVLSQLTGDETVDGSIASQLKSEADRAKAAEVANTTATQKVTTDLETEAKERAAAVNDLQGKIDDLNGTGTGSLGDLQGRVGVVEDALNDTTDSDGNLEKGLISKVNDTASLLAQEVATRTKEAADNLAEAKAYTDSKVLDASSLDIVAIGNTFRTALGLSVKSSNDDGSSL